MKLVWQDDRWHCGGEGIHAGENLELRGEDGQWFRVRIESADRGRMLIAYTKIHGLDLAPALSRPRPQSTAWRCKSRSLTGGSGSRVRCDDGADGIGPRRGWAAFAGRVANQ